MAATLGAGARSQELALGLPRGKFSHHHCLPRVGRYLSRKLETEKGATDAGNSSVFTAAPSSHLQVSQYVDSNPRDSQGAHGAPLFMLPLNPHATCFSQFFRWTTYKWQAGSELSRETEPKVLMYTSIERERESCNKELAT